MMSYLDNWPSYARVTGGTYSRFDTMLELDRNFASTLEGLAGWSQLGALDAVDVIASGGMTATPVNGYPFPMRIARD